jgi:hypothetical protein
MLEPVTTIVAALIGAIIGSVGAVLLAQYFNAKSEKRQKQEILTERYLFQLQDALAMLWYRLKNVAFQEGRNYMLQVYGSDDYYLSTTLYAIGKVLAIERIFVLEAVYPQLDAAYSQLGKYFKEFQRHHKMLDFHIFQWERYLLAEALIVHEGDLFRTITYLEFRHRYEAGEYKEWLKPAEDRIDSLTKEWMIEQMLAIHLLSHQVARYAHVFSTISSLAEKDVYFNFLRKATIREIHARSDHRIIKQNTKLRGHYKLLVQNSGKRLSKQERVLIGLVDDMSDDELRQIHETSQKLSEDEEIAVYFLERREGAGELMLQSFTKQTS